MTSSYTSTICQSFVLQQTCHMAPTYKQFCQSSQLQQTCHNRHLKTDMPFGSHVSQAFSHLVKIDINISMGCCILLCKICRIYQFIWLSWKMYYKHCMLISPIPLSNIQNPINQLKSWKQKDLRFCEMSRLNGY